MAHIGTYIKKENLPGDLLGNLEAVTINAGSRFLSGQASNVFGGSARNVVDNAQVIYNTVTDKNLIDRLSRRLIEHCVTVATREITSYLSDKTTDLLSLHKIKDVLFDSISEHTKANIIPPGELLKKIETKNVEKEYKKIQDDMRNSQIENIKNNITSGVGAIKEFADRTIGSLDAGLSTITSYLTFGPEWVLTQTDSYVAAAINKVQSFIGTYANSLIAARDTAIDSVGESIGKMAANTVNMIAENKLKKAKSDKEKLISLTQTKALNVVAKIAMQLRQLTGIAIPIKFPKIPKLTSLF